MFQQATTKSYAARNTLKVLPIALVELISQSPVQRSEPPTANIIDWSSQSHPH